jgi:putative transposase
MTSTSSTPSYAGYRFPAEVISYAVYLYFRFPLSLRMVEEMLAVRGIEVSHETVRKWGLKFGRAIANGIRRRRPQGGDKWHLDEMVVTIAGKKHYLWRAVDQDGFVLEALVQSRRDKKAAKRLLRKLLKKQRRAPRVMVTDKLKSYGAAKKEIMPGVPPGGRCLTARAPPAQGAQQPGRKLPPANPPTRAADEAVQVGPPRSALRLDPLANLFHFPRNQLTAADYRAARAQAFEDWAGIAGAQLAA